MPAKIKAKMKKYDTSKAYAMKARVTKDEGKTVARQAAKPTAKEATRKEAAKKAGASVQASKQAEPKRYGEGNKKVIRGNKANVSEAQLKASGMSLRQYMNAWNKTGKRPGKKA